MVGKNGPDRVSLRGVLSCIPPTLGISLEPFVQRVLIVQNGSLLCAGIQRLLAGELEMEVLSSSQDWGELAEEVRRTQPDVVVLDEASHLVNPANLLALLNAGSTLRVMVVSANDNLVRIYGKQQVLITQAMDLVNIIRSGKFFREEVRKGKAEHSGKCFTPR